jgi:Cu-Zn family superoxide dismutase
LHSILIATKEPPMTRLTKTLALSGLAGAALLGACAASDSATAGAAPAAPGARAPLYTASGVAAGEGRIVASATGLKLTVDAQGVPAGIHGIHVHTMGKCEGPDFQTAGGHWNPTARQHGHDNPQGAHSGDLPNITVGADGTGTLTIDLPGAKLNGEGGLLDADGAALVIHAAADDMKTDPSGNSGGRIACGVFAG